MPSFKSTDNNCCLKRLFLYELFFSSFFCYFYTVIRIMENKNMLASILFSLIGFMSTAQGPPPPGLPIDGGVEVLFLVAIIFGALKIMRINKKET